jgi:hypothetical protein
MMRSGDHRAVIKAKVKAIRHPLQWYYIKHEQSPFTLKIILIGSLHP